MIYLLNELTLKIHGLFDSKIAAVDYIKTLGLTDTTMFVYLQRTDVMTYISRICYVDGVIIYNNKDFWLNSSQDIYNDFNNHTVLDWRGAPVIIERFNKEMKENCDRLNMIADSADEVAFNIQVGHEFVSLFREECITSDIGNQSGLSIASSLSTVIPLVQIGSFKEAATVISTVPRNDFLTEALLTKYKNMLLSADIISYAS